MSTGVVCGGVSVCVYVHVSVCGICVFQEHLAECQVRKHQAVSLCVTPKAPSVQSHNSCWMFCGKPDTLLLAVNPLNMKTCILCHSITHDHTASWFSSKEKLKGKTEKEWDPQCYMTL